LPEGQPWANRGRSIDLDVLPPDDARELANVLVGRSSASSVLDPVAISEAAAGHPLFIDTLIRHAATQQESADRLDLDEALWAQVTSLPADAACLVETLCVASVPLPPQVATRAAGLDADTASTAISTLRTAHLLRVTATEELEAYHDRVRETVLHHLPPDRARTRHEHLAVVLTSEPNASAEALAIHWSLSAQPLKTVRQWMASPPHRALLMSSRFRFVGLGIARGRFGSRPATTWVAPLGAL
jgi:hypothetical protein